MISSPIIGCRLCGSEALDNILDLGAQPPANSLRERVEDVLEPIPLILCRCNACCTVQLTETVSPEYLFRDYVWVTGTSQSARDYSNVFYGNIKARSAEKNLFVIEVASNDGTFLKPFRNSGHRVLGIDPARNLADLARACDIPTEAEFFGMDTAKRVVQVNGHADVVIARNVLPHVPDPNDVIAGVSHCLRNDGIGAIEFHWVHKIINELHYDSIYHEHFFYHSLHSMQHLLNRHSLTLFDVTESPISGGSLVLYFSKEPRPTSKALQSKLDLEYQLGLASISTWRTFASRSLDHRTKLRKMIKEQVSTGKRVIGYGASARSSTLLNFCGLNSEYLECIADQNPMKHGRYTPGTNILIVSPEEAFNKQPDTILLLAWNFRDEIMERLEKIGFHGSLILPLPFEPELLKL